MNKIERVRAALHSQPVDRVPAGFWYHFPPAQAHGQASVDAHLHFFRGSAIDFLKVMNEHPYQTNVTIRQPSDWRQVRPAPLSADFYQEQLDEVKAILDKVGDEALVIVTLFGPFSSGNHAADNLVTEHIRADPQATSQGLAAIAESLARFGEACIDAGAAGIYYSAQGGEVDRFTEEEFLTCIKPQDLTVLNAIHSRGEFNLLHVCKDQIRLHLYADYPSHAVNWAATKHNLNLVEGKALFQRPVLGGLGDRGILVDGAPEQIQQSVKSVISQIGTTGFLLGADCTLPTDIDIAHIRAAVEATG